MTGAFDSRLRRIQDEIDLGMDCGVVVGYEPDGRVFVQIQCWRRDVITGEMGFGYGGKMWPVPQQSDDQIVQGIFGLYQGYWIHEARENFQWRGRRIYGPHTKIEALWQAARHVDVPSAMHVGERPPQTGAEQEQDQ